MADVKAVASRFSPHEGFSLVEMLVVIGILGIIAAFAYPSYRDHVTRANRSDAHIAIQRLSMAEERVYALQNQYSDDMSSLGGSASNEGLYTLRAVTGIWSGTDCSAASSDANATNFYTILATPVAGKSQENDDECTCIFMDSRGVKGSTGTPNNSEKCW